MLTFISLRLLHCLILSPPLSNSCNSSPGIQFTFLDQIVKDKPGASETLRGCLFMCLTTPTPFKSGLLSLTHKPGTEAISKYLQNDHAPAAGPQTSKGRTDGN